MSQGASRSSLRAPQAGATLVEFSLVLPVFLVLLMGAIDLGYERYMAGVLDGTLNQASRSITLQAGDDAATRLALDNAIRQTMGLTRTDISLDITRASAKNYRQIIMRGEPLNDANHNNRCDPGETFEDVNANGRFDSDSLRSEWGDADDVLVYQVTARMPRLFPVAGFIGLPDTITLTSTKMLRIQPFESQTGIRLLPCPPA